MTSHQAGILTSPASSSPLEDLIRATECGDGNTVHSEDVRSQLLSEESILERTQDCESYFRGLRTVGFEAASEAEAEFPLAFAFTVHKEIGIFEVFLATFFRPNGKCEQQ